MQKVWVSSCTIYCGISYSTTKKNPSSPLCADQSSDDKEKALFLELIWCFCKVSFWHSHKLALFLYSTSSKQENTRPIYTSPSTHLSQCINSDLIKEVLKNQCTGKTAASRNTGGSLLLLLSHFMHFYSEPSETGLTYSFHLFYL